MKQWSRKKQIGLVVCTLVFLSVILILMKQPSYAAWVHKEDGTVSYQNEDGKEVTGFQEIDGKRYYFDNKGNLQTGKFYVQDEDAYYYSDENGVISSGGIVTVNDGFYSVDESGKIQKGFIDLDQARYYFDEKASMVKGWFKYDGNWYYTDDSGKMVTGWSTIDGYRYYFGADGIRVSNTVMDMDGVAYVFNEDGSVDENATLVYPVYQELAAIRQSNSLSDIRQDSKVQACAILRAGGLSDGFSNVTEGEIETLLKNRGVKSNNGYEFSYGGIEGYSVDRLIQDMRKDTALMSALKDSAVTAVGIGVSTKDNINYYDIILICE